MAFWPGLPASYVLGGLYRGIGAERHRPADTNLRVSRKGLRGLTHERCSLPFPWRNSWNFLVFNLSYIQYTTKSLRNQLFPRKKLVFFGEFRYSAHNPDPDLAAASAPAGAPGSGPGHGDTAGRETAAPA